MTVKFDVVPAGTALDDQFGPLGVSGFSGPPQVTDCGTARTSASPLASSSPNLVSVGGSGELPSARTCIRLAQATNQAAVQVGAGSFADNSPVPIKLTAYRDIKLVENPVIDSETKTITPGTSLAGSAKRLAVTDTGGRRIRYLVLQVGDPEQAEGRLPRLDDLVYDYEGLIAPQFTLSAAGSGKRLRAGSTVKQALTVLRFGIPGMSDGPITLSAKDLPQGVTASFSPAVVSGSAESTRRHAHADRRAGRPADAGVRDHLQDPRRPRERPGRPGAGRDHRRRRRRSGPDPAGRRLGSDHREGRERRVVLVRVQ